MEGEANLNLDDEEIPNLIAGDEVDFESAFVFTSDDALKYKINMNLMNSKL